MFKEENDAPHTYIEKEGSDVDVLE